MKTRDRWDFQGCIWYLFYTELICNFDLGLSEITKLFVFFDTVRSKKINQVVQENIDKDLTVQKYDMFNNSQISHLKYAHVHGLYVFIYTCTNTHHSPS